EGGGSLGGVGYAGSVSARSIVSSQANSPAASRARRWTSPNLYAPQRAQRNRSSISRSSPSSSRSATGFLPLTSSSPRGTSTSSSRRETVSRASSSTSSVISSPSSTRS